MYNIYIVSASSKECDKKISYSFSTLYFCSFNIFFASKEIFLPSNIRLEVLNLFKRLGQDAYIQNDYIVVNPLGYYRGNDVDELNGLINLFEIN